MTMERLGKITVYNSDCMDIMKQYPDKHFDLAIIDPPYGIGEDGSKNHSRSKIAISKDYKSYSGCDNESPNDEYWTELFRVSKNQIIFGANHFISKIPFDSSCWIVWDKDNGNNAFADCELAWTSFESAVRKYKYKWHGMLQENMRNKQERIHPNEKPINLYGWILQKFAFNHAKVIDTHGGSMSHAIAAHDLGIDLVIIEKDIYYYTEAVKRLKWHQRQLNIF